MKKNEETKTFQNRITKIEENGEERGGRTMRWTGRIVLIRTGKEKTKKKIYDDNNKRKKESSRTGKKTMNSEKK